MSAHDFLECFPLCQFINQFVQKPYLLYKWVLNFFHANATHDARDQRAVRMNAGSLREKCLEVTFPFDLLFQICLAVASQPADDLIDFFSGAVFAFHLCDIQRVDL